MSFAFSSVTPGSFMIDLGAGNEWPLPVTLGVFIYQPDHPADNFNIISSQVASGTSQDACWLRTSQTDNAYQARTVAATGTPSASGGAILPADPAGKWVGLCARYTSSVSRRCYGQIEDGANDSGSNSTSVPIGNMRYVGIGGLYNSPSYGDASASWLLCEAAVWSGDIGDAAAWEFVQGKCARDISVVAPLIVYNPFRQSDYNSDPLAIGTLSVSGTTPAYNASHPRISYYKPRGGVTTIHHALLGR